MIDSRDNDFILLVTEPLLLRSVVPRITPTGVFLRYPTQLLDHYCIYQQEKIILAVFVNSKVNHLSIEN